MTGSPAVSVIIPTFDRRRRVVEAVRSVLGQTRPPAEVIVVDDGSRDATLASLGLLMAEQASWRGGTRLRLLASANRGVSAARNLGIRRAHGEWIAFLDSDDAWLPEKLARQLEAVAEQPELLICHCDEIWIRNGRRVNPRRIHAKRGGWIYEHCLPRCAISPSSVMLHRRLIEEVGLFDESLPACEDYDLWLRVCAHHPALYVDEQLVRKTGGHADQLSRMPALDRYRIRALTKMLADDRLGADLRQMTIETLQEKIQVYRAGVVKRGRHDEAAELDALLHSLEAMSG